MNLGKIFIDFFSNIDNVELAYQLFATLQVGTNIDKKYKNEVNRIIKDLTNPNEEYPDRQKVLLKVIELAGNTDTPKQRYIIAKAYSWSRVAYRKQAIQYLEIYLNNTIYEGAYKNISHGLEFSVEDEKNIHISNMYNLLGKAYEGEYEFDKALMCYMKEVELTPFYESSYVDVGNIYVKMNKLDKALEIYNQAKASVYYKINKRKDVFGKIIKNDMFMKQIDSRISEIKNKIENNYIYKPRKKHFVDSEK